MSNRLDKNDYTIKFMDLLDIPRNTENIRKYTLFWWYNVRGSSGLRLTKPGYLTLTKELKLKEYRFKIIRHRKKDAFLQRIFKNFKRN